MPSSSSNMTKAERREAAREQARQLREAQAKREKRNRNLIIVGVIALVVVVGIALYAIISQGTRSAIESVDNVPANSSVDDGGIPLGSELVAGTSNDGAPVLDVYLDFSCPHCGTFEEVNAEDINEVVSAGEATVVYHPVAILDRTGNWSGFSGRAAQAAAVVADQAPEAYNDFQSALFELIANATSAEPTDEEIAAAAVEAGVPQEVADTLTVPLEERPFTEWVQATTQQFSRDGYSGTPTVMIDGDTIEPELWGQPGALAEELRAS
ncbi:DsbA family protein [Georgenia subflava]|uniref:Thioredoxin domain-containing protein n=1 Tax=Georgenia subflava TaxID=1622177 RepID=A0A6N7EPL6_9MICO|nr:thioredoxin domain-containing protein [Georgenia subflava]MPV38455.1 thioredoxin domain-containing protein [Georgenia subflava]